jgi:dihydroorotate dehydrogenase electron transfer subunit
MNPVLHAALPVMMNERLARDTYRLRLATPELARAIRPGQFLMLRPTHTTDPLLGRPFALYDTVLDARGEPTAVDIVYLIVGRATGLLATLKPEDEVSAWGPLGNGFPTVSNVEHVGLVAGGIGQTPFLAYVRELLGTRGYGGLPARKGAGRVSLYYGVRSADLAAGVEDFRAAGAEVYLASNDGSLGYHGFVTQLLEQQTPPVHLLGCGPEPMLRALTGLARSWSVPCHVSLETPMACGVGICFSCVTPVQTAEGLDYRRVCIEGPVFESAHLAWESGSMGRVSRGAESLANF